MTEQAIDNANTLGRPPFVVLAATAIGVVLHLLRPVTLLPGFPAWAVGILLSALAVGLFTLSVQAFARHGTPVRGTEPVTTIVANGPYRFSRNPIYLSFLLLQLAVALLTNSVWVVIVMLPTFVYLTVGVIAREENYLERKFGEEYLRYKSAVRRWF